MKVVCKKNTAKGLDLKEVTTLFVDNYHYGLILEKEYVVMGIMIDKYSNCLYYLIDENKRPDWYPYMLFEISDNRFPENWYIAIHDKKDKGDLFSLFGFYELCNDNDFYDLLIERDKKAMNIYFERKNEFEHTD